MQHGLKIEEIQFLEMIVLQANIQRIQFLSGRSLEETSEKVRVVKEEMFEKGRIVEFQFNPAKALVTRGIRDVAGDVIVERFDVASETFCENTRSAIESIDPTIVR